MANRLAYADPRLMATRQAPLSPDRESMQRLINLLAEQTTAEVASAEAAAADAVNTAPVEAGWPWIVLAGIIVVVLWATGCFSRGVLQRTPLRHMELNRADLWIGLFCVLIAPLTGGLAAVAFFITKAFLCPGGFRASGLVPRRPGRDVLYAVVGLVVGFVLTTGTLLVVAIVAAALNNPAPAVNHSMLTELQNDPSFKNAVTVFLLAVVMAPVLEELTFRGLLQTLLLEFFGRDRRWLVLMTAAALFAVVHLGAVSWHALPGLFVLGMVLGWLYERTGSLWPSILVHAAFNACNISVVILTAKA